MDVAERQAVQAPAETSRRWNVRGWKIGWLTPLLLLVIALLVLRFCRELVNQRIGLAQSATPGTPHGMDDFRDALYLPSRYLWHGGNPWNPGPYSASYPQAMDFGLYSPANFLIFAPILVLPWGAATVAWVVLVEVPALAVGVWFVWRRFGAPRRLDVVLACVCAALLWQPMMEVLRLGNPSVVTTIVVALALWPGTSARGSAAATALAWLKPHFGLPTSALSAAAGRVRAVGQGLVATGLLAAPAAALAVAHAGGVVPFLRALPSNFKNTANSPYGGNPLLPGRYDSVSLLSRAVGHQIPVAVQAVVVVAVIATGATAYVRLARRGYPELALTAGVLTVLLTIHQMSADFAAGFVLLGALGARLWRDRPTGVWVRREAAWLASAAVIILLAVLGFRLPKMNTMAGISWDAARDIDEALAVLAWLTCVVTAILGVGRARSAARVPEGELPAIGEPTG